MVSEQKKDYDTMNDGCVYRLMECLNFRYEKDKLVYLEMPRDKSTEMLGVS